MQWNHKIKFTFYAKNLDFDSIISQWRDIVKNFKAELKDQILYAVQGGVNFKGWQDRNLYHANQFGLKPIKGLQEWRDEIWVFFLIDQSEDKLHGTTLHFMLSSWDIML